MIPDPDRICTECMSELPEPLGICSVCGADNHDQSNLPIYLEKRSVLYGKYLIGKVLGQGGFGITYIGMDLNLQVKVAIKEYFPTSYAYRRLERGGEVDTFSGEPLRAFEYGKERFIDEARILAQLSAQQKGRGGIVNVRDFFHGNNTAYLVMDHVAGSTLKQVIRKQGGKLPAHDVLALMEPIVRSMQRVHAANILHRDISPDNIIIDDSGFATLIDFGAARNMHRRGDASARKKANGGDSPLGPEVKEGYTPPEQYQANGKQGPWTDVYSLCATIYKAITGITPPQSLSRLLKSQQLLAPSSLGVELTPLQEKVLLRGLEVDIKRRIPDMQILWKSLYTTDATEQMVDRALSANGRSRRLVLGAICVTALGVVFFLAQPLLSPDGLPMPWDALPTAKPEPTVTVFAYLTPTSTVAITATPEPMGTETPKPNETDTPKPLVTATPNPTSTGTSPSPSPTDTPAATNTPPPADTPAQTSSPAPTSTPSPAPLQRKVQFTQDDIRYTIDERSRARATAYLGSGRTVTLPAVVGGITNYPLAIIESGFSESSTSPATVRILSLPSLALTIEDGAFSAFTSLSTIEGGENIKNVSKAALEGTAWLDAMRESPPSNGLITCFDGLVLEYVNQGSELVLDTSIRGVATGAFDGAGDVRSITFEGDIWLQTGAFYGLSGLKTLIVSGQLTCEGSIFDTDEAPLLVRFLDEAEISERFLSALPSGSVVALREDMANTTTRIPSHISVVYEDGQN